MGLDISVTGTGVAITETVKSRSLHTLWAGVIPSKRDDRYGIVDDIAEQAHTLISDYKPDVVALEGYGQGVHGNVLSFVKVVEVGTMIRMMLYSAGYSWMEVPPLSLKKFVVGRAKGVGKREMISGIRERWGYTTKNHNIADAFACSAFALAKHSAISIEPWQVDAMDRVKSG